jgi:hypothetical protein
MKYLFIFLLASALFSTVAFMMLVNLLIAEVQDLLVRHKRAEY